MTNLKISTNPSTGLSAYVDEATKEAFLTDTLICKVTGIDHKSLDKIIQSEGVGNYELNYAQAFTVGGLQGVGSLRKASDFKRIIKAWKPTKQENQDRKEAILDAMVDAGVTAYVYSLCGYSMQQIEVGQPALPFDVNNVLSVLKYATAIAEEAEKVKLALEAAQPAIEFTKAIEASSNTVSMGEMAKMLGIGRTAFFGKLRQMKVIQQKDTLPYQQHLDSGYFEVTENTAGYPCTRVTGTGQIWLQKKFATFEANLAKKEVAIEAIEQIWDYIPLK